MKTILGQHHTDHTVSKDAPEHCIIPGAFLCWPGCLRWLDISSQKFDKMFIDVCVTIEDEEAGQWTGSVTLGPVTETVTQWTIVLGKDFIGFKNDLQLIS